MPAKQQDAISSINDALFLGEKNQVGILPKGGLVNEFWVFNGGRKINVICGFESDNHINTDLKNTYYSARLAPFPNRIKDGKYSYDGVDYQLPINFEPQLHAMHGFLADVVYKVLEHEPEKLVLSYHYDGNYKGFPFPFSTQLSYTFNGKRLSCKSIIENTGVTKMPYGEGWHPYFRLGGKVNDWSLKFQSKQKIGVDERMIPTGNNLDYTDFHQFKMIGEKHFDSCYSLSNENGWGQVVLQSSTGLELSVYQELGRRKYNYMQLYTPERRDCLAIEPMTCTPDVLNNGMGLIEVKSQEIIELNWGIEVSTIKTK